MKTMAMRERADESLREQENQGKPEGGGTMLSFVFVLSGALVGMAAVCVGIFGGGSGAPGPLERMIGIAGGGRMATLCLGTAFRMIRNAVRLF